jgi:hypothetical protein
VEEAKAALQNADASAPSMIEVQTGTSEEEAPAAKQNKKAPKKSKGKKKK